MKILLTGKPGIGKSTILDLVKKDFAGEKFGIIGREIRNKEGNRVGFEAVSHKGKRKTYAHTEDLRSDYVVVEKYFVDLEVIDNFVVSEIRKGINNPKALVFIDEIGRMQAFSQRFLETVSEILTSNSNVLASIVFDPEPWSIKFKTNDHVILIHVSKSNRNELPRVLQTIYDNSDYFHKLTPKQREFVIRLAKEYFDNEKYIQVSKLFKNAIPYVVQEKINGKSSKFKVEGNTRQHFVKQEKDKFLCDCDLFNGRGQYGELAGECSHIQAVKLSQIH